MTDDLTAELARLRACAEAIPSRFGAFDLKDLMPRFARAIAAVEAALELADDWDNEAVRQDAVVARSVPGGQRATLASGRAQAHKDCADALLGAITRELNGESNG